MASVNERKFTNCLLLISHPIFFHMQDNYGAVVVVVEADVVVTEVVEV